MYSASLMCLYISIIFNIPLSRLIMSRPSGLDDIKYTLKIKTGKLFFLFISHNPEYKQEKKMYLVEFLIQICAYICTLINLPFSIISPIVYFQQKQDAWMWVNLIFGFLYIVLYVLIELIYSFFADLYFPNFREIPTRKLKKAEKEIIILQKELIKSLDSCDMNKIGNILNRKNLRLFKRYKNTGLRLYYNKKTNKFEVYFNSELFQFSSNIVDHVKSIFQELNKKIIDWEYLRSIIINQNE